MKRIIVWAALLLLLAGTAQAQVRFGVVAGANASGFFTESTVADDLSPQFNFRLGGALQYDFWIFTLQPELAFSRVGGRINDAKDKFYLKQYAGLTESNPDLDFTSNRIELPVNLLYKINVKKAKVFAEIGPFLAFDLGGTFNGSAQKYREYAKAMPFRWIDYGVGAGAGAEFGKYQVHARWDWGLNRLGSPVENVFGTNNINVFNDMKYLKLSLSLGYFF